MNLQDVINNCDINFEVGTKVRYMDSKDIEKEGTIVQISLILNSKFGFLNGDVEYIVEYYDNQSCKTDRIFEDNIISR